MEAYAIGVHRQAIQLPTGAGKTLCFAEVIRQRTRMGRQMVLCHRDELITQAAAKLRMVAPELSVGIVKAERNEVQNDVIVASVQTLSREKRLRLLPPSWATVVCDEAHHSSSVSWKRVLEHVLGPETLLLGVSATLERSDKVKLDDIYEQVTYELNMLDLMRQGYLCDIRALEVMVDINVKALHKRGGDYVDSELAQELHEANAPALAVQAYEEHAPGRKALLFAPTVDSAAEFMQAFADAGHAVGMVWGAQPADARHETLQRFAEGDLRIICNCMVLTEGFDEPSVDCVIMARPTCSKPLYVQMIGRGTRTHPGKDDLLVLDLVGAASRMGDLMTTASLFGVDPQQEGADIGVLEGTGIRREKEAAVQLAGELVAREVDLFRRRDLHWGDADGRYTLSAGNSGLLIVERAYDSSWLVRRYYEEKLDYPPFRLKLNETLAQGLDLGYAQGFAEDYVRQAGATVLNNPKAAWRRKEPSEAALKFAKRMGVKVPEGATAGEVSEMIDKAKALRGGR